ncbi:LOW QUALITY PROTEIN: Patatin-related protein [Trema orientale]|uniref:Patatin n=1 Tax=Trema orientale TaxID=63057 RepID=A0A2P5FYA3_TREOI|nr:LOW QUALITY PROTEIN: Patatin-related protein [Trema orientale]
MISAPNASNRPFFAAKDIVPFYLEHSPKIFPQTRGVCAPVVDLMKALKGPKYDGKYLHNLISKNLGGLKLHDTLTNVVIPTFDVKKLQPIIFSSYQIKTSTVLDAQLSDICISTSAAPTYFPAHSFENKNEQGEDSEEFNLIDGGIAVNNPALVAISEVTKQIIRQNLDFDPVKPMDYNRFLVISIGTGSNRSEQKYSAKMTSKWGIISWSITTTNGDVASVDVATDENLKKLVEVGQNLLKKPVSRLNVETGLYEPIKNGGTNEEALKRFAKLLSDEKKLRESNAKVKGPIVGASHGLV